METLQRIYVALSPQKGGHEKDVLKTVCPTVMNRETLMPKYVWYSVGRIQTIDVVDN